MRLGGRRLVGATVSAALLMPSATATATAAKGELRLRDRAIVTNGMYIEGAFEYVTVRRARDHKLAFRTRFDQRLRERLELRPGYYDVGSWTRTCSGNCQTLDPPILRCRGTFRVRAHRFITATIVHGVELPCRVTNP